MQVTDTAMISSPRRNPGHLHHLVTIDFDMIRKPATLPQLQERSKKADMGNTDPGIVADPFKEYPLGRVSKAVAVARPDLLHVLPVVALQLFFILPDQSRDFRFGQRDDFGFQFFLDRVSA
jgi:hypothetical protein